MSEEFIVEQCSPTLAGLKTGNLFPYPKSMVLSLDNTLNMFNKRLAPKGIKLVCVGELNNKYLIYMYRPHMLSNDLSDELAKKILFERNYPLDSVDSCVLELSNRIKDGKAFPHEIGLFLGYPSEDVEGFITNKPPKLVGTWKVYGNELRAQKQFDKFKKCTNVYKKCFSRNHSLDKLAVNQLVCLSS